MPQWVAREFLARKGNAKFNDDQISEARCSLLGYSLNSMRIEGKYLPKELLKVELQEEVGTEAYDAGAKILHDFFKSELEQFLVDDLDPKGRKIIECCMNNGNLKEYEALM